MPQSPFDPSRIAAVVFDYGNTLIPFGPTQARSVDLAMVRALEQHYGRVDQEKLFGIRRRNRLAPYQGELRENDLATICRAMIGELYRREPDDGVIELVLDARYQAFLEAVAAPPEVRPLLERLRRRFRLGLISNYPDGRVIRESLSRISLMDLFDAIVVSGDVGHVKPHPLPFQTLIDQMGIDRSAVLYVGDNWLGDIQGAKRFGMRAAHITQYEVAEHFDPQDGDHEPDLVLAQLAELEDHLGR